MSDGQTNYPSGSNKGKQHYYNYQGDDTSGYSGADGPNPYDGYGFTSDDKYGRQIPGRAEQTRGAAEANLNTVGRVRAKTYAELSGGRATYETEWTGPAPPDMAHIT
ncbi:hypothetical protein P7C73_g6115, partial [Tremellales sp. Uapishka_1]